MEGTVSAPKIAMAEGATFNGKIEMPKKGQSPVQAQRQPELQHA